MKGRVRVAWTGDCAGRYLLRYSNDGGTDLPRGGPSLSETEYIVDLDTLPGGERCQFQVLATTGICTGSALSSSFSVPQKPRQALIQGDGPHTGIDHGQLLRLSGLAFSPEAGSADPRDLQWSSDKDGPLGVGSELISRSLSPGLHIISLRAPDGLGGTSVTEHEVRVAQPLLRSHTSREHPKHTQRDHDLGEIPPR